MDNIRDGRETNYKNCCESCEGASPDVVICGAFQKGPARLTKASRGRFGVGFVLSVSYSVRADGSVSSYDIV